MKKSDFYYELPEELIAQTPVLMRDSSRLMIIKRDNPEISHKVFSDITDYLSKGDCLVLNDTRVMPARLLGHKEGSGGKIEFVLLKRLRDDIWEVLLKPGRKAREGSRFVFGDGALTATVIEVLPDGNRKVQFFYKGVFEEVLSCVGIMPLPPYITEKLSDKERYQTVYNRASGSAAAPTAGLHFTPALLQKLQDQGVAIVYLTLHVGLGTFRPVKVDDILEHKMHQEYYEIGEAAAKIINRTKQKGGRVIAVGTTSSRVLESVSNQIGEVIAGSGWTDIFIYPGYQFKVVKGLITNFHLPESTLLMLVSALCGRERILEAYHLAIQERYRFLVLEMLC